MAERRPLGIYSIPPHRAFADTLAIGLLRRYGDDPMRLARGTILVPNHRGGRAITDAFVRESGGGLLLPRIVAIGDPELDDAMGALLDPADAEPLPPAIAPLRRRLVLARLLCDATPLAAPEALRLAGDLARTLDQLLIEEVAPAQLRDLALAPELAEHWQTALTTFETVLDRWPDLLRESGMIELAERRRLLHERAARRWRDAPPAGFVCAAGITAPARSIARLLRSVAGLREGHVVLPGVDRTMDAAEWDALGPHEPDPGTGITAPSIETHPQFHLKLLLDRMGVARAEVMEWRVASELDAPPARTRAIATALAPAAFTDGWPSLPRDRRRFDGVEVIETGTPAEEAQAIALKLRETLETPGRTAALVTPDRALARRVAAHCARWHIAIDDSAGQPLAILPPGTLLLAIAETLAQRFAPTALLALLKHPLVASGDERLAWLEGVRSLDLALRGPRPAPGLEGIEAHLAQGDRRTARIRAAAAAWWPEARERLAPIARLAAIDTADMPAMAAMLREAATALAGDAAWSRTEGRAAADLLAALETEGADGPRQIAPDDLLPMLRLLLDEIAVRPAQGGHPRLAIYGLIEARMQRADLMILGGLNEGVWPAAPAPDPWLAPRIRAELGLAGLERRIGLAAHDFAMALGAPQVLLTRARCNAGAPTIASRLWLRIEALAENVAAPAGLAEWAPLLDRGDAHRPAVRPGPAPPVADRPRELSVTEVDRLKADPYAFYARRMLRLSPLDPIDADPSAAWRGTMVHAVLEAWAREDDCRPDALRPRALAMLDAARAHPVLRALWEPRLIAAIDWIAERLADEHAAGRRVLGVERSGALDIAGVRLTGKYDRIDRMPDGSLGIVDYKTGKAPSARAVAAGYQMQLGLIGLMAERGAFAGIEGTAAAFEYWSLAKARDGFGSVSSPVGGRSGDAIAPEDFVAMAARQFEAAVERWLTGDEPFTAKLVPEYAPYAEYDQLMRRDEWYGRD
ncbi:double-strand break repair protein AddB [Sphingomonas baiyangensis]|uniref:Double-strand break repair protein AddB n=1 Tax=Sphingomonas baiyangensis TaxID=2572576 RepID=A0A4V5PTL7_9SPHN|nr:double-strand break repair protein AddB [Sphingomonas baiyangensis]TKD50498.1 double-strand break repair protein AddB [Sphingomonas baiyangensis]